MPNILVTGGAGFIGSHIVDELINQGHQVIIIDNLSTGNISNINSKAIFFQKDINSDLNWIFRVYAIDYVFHQAAQINLRHSIVDPHFDAEQNILGSLNVIHTSSKHNVKKIFFASTGGAIYAESSPLPWQEDTLASPASPYGLSKLTVEKYLNLYNRLHNLEYVSLRYSNVYGERQNSKGEAGVISIFIDKIKNGQNITIFGDGEQTRDFVCVHDVVSANLHALNNDLKGIFNVSSNTETSVKQIADLLIQEKNIQITHLPAIPGEIKNTRLSFSKLQSTGWQPKHNLFSTLQLMIDKGI